MNQTLRQQSNLKAINLSQKLGIPLNEAKTMVKEMVFKEHKLAEENVRFEATKKRREKMKEFKKLTKNLQETNYSENVEYDKLEEKLKGRIGKSMIDPWKIEETIALVNKFNTREEVIRSRTWGDVHGDKTLENVQEYIEKAFMTENQCKKQAIFML